MGTETAYTRLLLKGNEVMMQPSDLDEVESIDGSSGRDWARHPIVIGVVAVGLFALGFLAFVFSADRLQGNDASEDRASDTTSTAPATTADEASDTTADGEGAAESTTSSMLPDADDLPEGAFVEATLNLDAAAGPGMFKLTGRVPDQQTADAVLQAAELSYAPFVESDLEVDESLEPAPWLAVSPRLIGLLPTITDGTIRIVDGTVQLDARSPNPEYLALLQAGLEQLSEGVPVEVVDTEITDLRPPLFQADVADSKVTLSGFIPSEEIREILVGGAIAAYGPENVTDELTIEGDTYISFWMYTMPGVFQLFTPFPQYSFKVEDGFVSGALQGGVNFAVDSAEITAEAAQVLNVGVAVMARDISIFMTVEGHTDSSGPADYNQALSVARAESVVAYFSEGGIDPSRLAATGQGENEPIATNETVEGKALNRRVEFIFGPALAG